jgi:syntaxin 1B/2/3
MAVLVATQGEMVDHIAIHVNDAVNDTEAGVNALKSAVKIQKNTRKRMCLILVVLCIIIGVCIAVPTLMK